MFKLVGGKRFQRIAGAFGNGGAIGSSVENSAAILLRIEASGIKIDSLYVETKSGICFINSIA